MEIIKEKAPHIRKRVSVTRMMVDVLIALVPSLVFAFVMNGLAALKVVGISVVTMIVSEFLFLVITKRINVAHEFKFFKENKRFDKFSINNITSPLISAIIFALIMPASASWYAVLASSLFGIVIGKLVFGGLGSNIFNPAAVGRVFAGICFGSMFTYSGNSFYDVVAGGTPLGQLVGSLTNIDKYTLLNLFIGTVPGALGETSAICILIGGIYLFIRRSADIRTTLANFIVFVILIGFAGVALGMSNHILEFIAYHLLSGGFLFGAIFMVTDPVTSSTTRVGRIAFGSIVAICTVFIRIFGAYPEGVAFSILIANIFAPLLDSPKIATNKYRWYQPLILLGVLAVIVGIMFVVLPSKGVSVL